MPSLFHKYRWIILFLILTIVTTAFIFHNSLQDSQTSNDRSSTVTEVVKPIVDPQGEVEEDTFHKITRKLAHGIEFCILGCCMAGLMYSVHAVFQRYHLSMVLFGLLSTAVTDEYIQSFTGRTSSVKDILIDVCGGIIGLVLAVIIMKVYRIVMSQPAKNEKTVTK